MNEVGGYFGLELKKGKEYHLNSIRLNSGRNALQYILIANNYTKVYLPYYTCDVLLQPIKNLNLKYEFYSINESFEAHFDFEKIKNTEAFLYTNYFGLKDQYIIKIKEKCTNLIIDNAQAFFALPHNGVDTFYSPRKFFGLPDGAYLYSNKLIEKEFPQDISYNRFEQILRRSDLGAENGYSYFTQNENSLNHLPIKKMSNLTKAILQSIDYSDVASIRRKNFQYLHDSLNKINQIKFDLINDQVPMVYPFLTDDLSLRKKLIANKVYIAQYWPSVLGLVNNSSIEYQYTERLIHLPIDQRLGINELDRISRLIK